MAETVEAQAVAIHDEVAELKEQVRKLRIELAETQAFFRGITDELSQQVKEAKAAIAMRSGAVPAPPRLRPQR